MTLSNDEYAVSTIKNMMMGSREACVNYMTPLGLHHIMQERIHYGPEPDFSRPDVREDWTSVYYHRADKVGIGFNRSSTGSKAVDQYYPPIRDLFDNIDTCPEKYLLWFHHAPWDRRMHSGRILWDELCHRYYKGVDYVTGMRADWASLEKKIDPEIFAHVVVKLETHERDAAILHPVFPAVQRTSGTEQRLTAQHDILPSASLYSSIIGVSKYLFLLLEVVILIRNKGYRYLNSYKFDIGNIGKIVLSQFFVMK